MISIKRLENDAKNARLKHGVNAVLSTLDDWQLRAQVWGLVLGTTSSNTRLNMGACTLLDVHRLSVLILCVDSLQASCF